MCPKAVDVLRPLVLELEQGYGLGSMTCSIYDTAWVSCISKPSDDGSRQWLFVSSFRSLLDSQSADGGWHWPPQRDPEDVAGTILSSLAALFAIKQHVKNPLQLIRLQDEANDRWNRGILYMSESLRGPWRLSGYSVGFEIIVPALLELLETEGTVFAFPGKRELFRRRDSRFSRVLVGQQLDKVPSTLLHSVEALYGDMQFSFDTLRDNLVNGSVMGSPSATAAFLMRCKEWDNSAEAYLRLTLSNGAGNGSGEVPSAYPSTNFELIWVASILLKAGCIEQDLNAHLILESFDRWIPEGGLVGFSPGIQPDVDDSANASIVLSLLGKPGLSRQMRELFETATHFETYRNESSGSLSANCSLLLALLLDLQQDPGAVSAIEKVSKYLASKWFNAFGPVKDKWNVSEYYSTMLLAQAFVKLLRCWEAFELAPISEELLRDQVIPVVFRCLLRIVHTQNSDGSWGSKGPREETAYAILALVELAGLPMASSFKQQTHSALLRGRNYLKAHSQASKPEYLWVEKVLYGVQNISKAYILAALSPLEHPPLHGQRIMTLLSINYSEMAEFADLFQKLPLLASQPRWLVLASWTEGQLFLPMLHEVRRAAFRRAGMSKDKYFKWIPVLWALANNTNGYNMSARLLFDMMRVSVLNFQADELMEMALDAGGNDYVSTVREMIEDLFQSVDHWNEAERPNVATRALFPSDCADHDIPINDRMQDTNSRSKSLRDSQSTPDAVPAPQHVHGNDNDTLFASAVSLSESLRLFIHYITAIAKAACVSKSSLHHIHMELKAFLHAHLTQTQLNRSLFVQKQAAAAPQSIGTPLVQQSSAEAPSFRTWLYNTAAVHTSCPYSFALYLALASAGDSQPLLRTLRQRYVAEDLCGNLARMCRLYNDYGSLKRDITEGNLNCVNFSEFHQAANEDGSPVSASSEVAGVTNGYSTGSGSKVDGDRLKEQLMELADWERKGIERAMEQLERDPHIDTRLIGALNVFVTVTDLFGQVYVVKDLASRKL